MYLTLIMKCPRCFWHNYYKICPICHHHADPRGEKLHQRGLSSVSRLWSNNTQKREDRRWKPVLIPLLKRGTKTRINFSFLSNCCVFGSFGHWFSIKSISRVFHNNNNNNNNNNNKSRFSLGVFTVEPETIVRKKEELMDLNLVINEIQNKLRL